MAKSKSSLSGDLREFLDETPAFWFDLFKLKRDVNGFAQGLEHQLEYFSQEWVSSNIHHFDNYKVFLQTFGGEEAAGFTELASMLWELSQVRANLKFSFHKWQEVCNKHVWAAEEANKKLALFNKQKKKYFAQVKTHLATKSSNVNAKAIQEDQRLLKQWLELDKLRLELDESFKQLKQDRSRVVLQSLHTCMMGYQELFAKGTALLDPYRELLGRLGRTCSDSTALSSAMEAEMQANREAKEAELKEMVNKALEAVGESVNYGNGSGIRDLRTPGAATASTAKEKEGYLYTPSPNFSRVYVELKGGYFIVSPTDLQAESPVKSTLQLPIMLCTVKEMRQLKMRMVFSVISPQQSVLLQATSIPDMQEWLACIQNAISHQLMNRMTMAGPRSNKRVEAVVDVVAEAEKQKKRRQRLEALWAIEGNSMCADCKDKDPEWVSMNIGVMICLSCSAAHRSLGVHISKVRSVALDTIDPFLLEYFKAIGNSRANRIWEAALEEATAAVNREDRSTWIQAKYKFKAYLDPKYKSLKLPELTRMMFDGINEGRPLEIYKAIAWGADPNAKNKDEDNRTALHHAVNFGDVTCVDALILNGGDLTLKEDRGWTPLHYAAYQGDDNLVDLIVMRGGPKLLPIKDFEDRTPRDLAATAEDGTCLQAFDRIEQQTLNRGLVSFGDV